MKGLKKMNDIEIKKELKTDYKKPELKTFKKADLLKPEQPKKENNQPEKENQTEKKRKYTKRRGRKKQTTVQAVVDLERLYAMIFNNILSVKDDRWKLQDEEITTLASTTDAYLEKKFPGLLENQIEIAFYASIASIILPRFILIVQPQNWFKRTWNNIKSALKGKKDFGK